MKNIWIILLLLLTNTVSNVIAQPAKREPIILISDDNINSLLDLKKEIIPVENDMLYTFAELGIDQGYVIYSKHFSHGVSGLLGIEGLRDFAIICLDRKKIGVLDHHSGYYQMDIEIPFNTSLDIIVENTSNENGEKGIITPVYINDYEIEEDWKMYILPSDTVMNMVKNK